MTTNTVIRATHAQDDVRRYGELAGRQCMAIAVVFGAYAARSSAAASRRTPALLDRIIGAGTIHFGLSLEHRRNTTGSFLNLEEVVPFIEYPGLVTPGSTLQRPPPADLNLHREVVLQHFDVAEVIAFHNAAQPLGQQSSSSIAIIVYNGYALCIASEGRNGRGAPFTLFNSHRCDAEGLPTHSLDDGRAAMTVCSTREALMAVVIETLRRYGVSATAPPHAATCTLTFVRFKRSRSAPNRPPPPSREAVPPPSRNDPATANQSAPSFSETPAKRPRRSLRLAERTAAPEHNQRQSEHSQVVMQRRRKQPQLRDRERVRDAQRRRNSRQENPSQRALAQQLDTAAHQLHRLDLNYRSEEQERDTEAHRRARRRKTPSHCSARGPLPENRNELRHSLGRLGDRKCPYCGAHLFHPDNLKCCYNGGVQLPPLRVPDEFRDLFGISDTPSPLKERFLSDIRLFNRNFQMVIVMGSVRQNVFEEISYVPRFGTAGFSHFDGAATIMVKGDYFHCARRSEYGGPSLFYLDPAEEQAQRLRILRDCVPARQRAATTVSDSRRDEERAKIMHIISQVLHRDNPHVQNYKTARKMHEEQQTTRIQLDVAIADPDDLGLDPRTYNRPEPSAGIAVAVHMPEGAADPTFEVMFKTANGRYTGRMRDDNRLRLPLQYPVAFPMGELGYQPEPLLRRASSSRINDDNDDDDNEDNEDTAGEIEVCEGPVDPEGGDRVGRQQPSGNQRRRAGKVTILRYAQYLLAYRGPSDHLCRLRKLFQQIIADLFVTYEGNRLGYLRKIQGNLRRATIETIQEHLRSEASRQGLRAGNVLILPSSYLGSQRFMTEKYRDAMAIVREFGRPDLFITMTCNPKWPEILDILHPGEVPADQPLMVCRIFAKKVAALLQDLCKREIFGKIAALVYTIEFQKRGLPHVHMLVILDRADKFLDAADVDAAICAEIPDPELEPALYRIVCRNMLHECSEIRCQLSKGKCSKGFPKQFNEETTLHLEGAGGYPLYRRRENGRKAHVRGEERDNRSVVPYSPHLLLRYDCHINVEVCSSVKACKYIFKYIMKGSPVAMLKVRRARDPNTGEELDELTYDEIAHYIDTRYVGSLEAAWRLLELPMHYRQPAVVKQFFHLEGEQSIVFASNVDSIDQLIERGANRTTQLTAWFVLNQELPAARQYTYVEIGKHFRFVNNKWQPRVHNTPIVVRLPFVSPAAGDVFFLRCVLLHARGARSYQELRTYAGTTYTTFREVARAMGIIENDKEWDHCLQEAAHSQTGRQLRNLFVLILLHCENVDAAQLWESHKHNLCDDFLRQQEQEIAESFALADIQHQLALSGKTLQHFGLPMPSVYDSEPPQEDLLYQVTEHDADELWNSLNDEQLAAATSIWQTIMADNNSEHSEQQRLFFLHGVGGTGKTYVYRAICARMYVHALPFACAAPTGLAALLLPQGRTLHSQFGLSIDDSAPSSIRPSSDAGAHLRSLRLIVIDEASMISRTLIRRVDHLLRDVTGVDAPFGGRIVVFGGDFRQLLPVVRGASIPQAAASSIRYADFWQNIRRLELTINMRALDAGEDFINWLLQVGNGLDSKGQRAPSIHIPARFICHRSLPEEIFGASLDPRSVYTKARHVILTPLVETTRELNDYIMTNILQGNARTYWSVNTSLAQVDHPEPDSSGSETEEAPDAENIRRRDPIRAVPGDDVADLNSINISGIPSHELVLKEGAICFVCRNLSASKTLLNGRRVVVRQLLRNSIAVEFLDEPRKGDVELLPRIDFRVDAGKDCYTPFRRRQFPLIPAFAMTINKAQGQTFDMVGIDLPATVFGHGQLYVALSRCRRPENLRVRIRNPRPDRHHIIQSGDHLGEGFTHNCVFYGVL